MMKTQQKLLIICLAFLISIVPACETVHESASIRPKMSKMSFKEASNSIKEAIRDAKPTPSNFEVIRVTDIELSEKGITIFYDNNVKKYYAFSDIEEPRALTDVFMNHVILKASFVDSYGNIFFNNAKSAIMFADALYFLKHYDDSDVKNERGREQEDCLRLARQTPIDLILAGSTADGLNLPCSAVPKPQIESILNENLVEWKSEGLRECLQKSSSAQLSDLVVKMEKGILKLDLKAKELKDAADEDARKVQVPGQAAPAKTAPADALATAHLLDQRKTILMVILGSVKQVAGQRASGG